MLLSFNFADLHKWIDNGKTTEVISMLVLFASFIFGHVSLLTSIGVLCR